MLSILKQEYRTIPMKNKLNPSALIVHNKKAKFNYILHDKFTAGLCLQGWEVKSLRAKKVQITESYIGIKDQELWLRNLLITPLASTAHYPLPVADQERKLLLHKREIQKIIGLMSQKNLTSIPLSLFWSNNHIKLIFATATGKKLYDKRVADKEKVWNTTL